MRTNKKLLISPEQDPRYSSVFVGYIILKELKKEDRITIFDLYSLVKRKMGILNTKTLSFALIFLFMNDLIDFNNPYIIKRI